MMSIKQRKLRVRYHLANSILPDLVGRELTLILLDRNYEFETHTCLEGVD